MQCIVGIHEKFSDIILKIEYRDEKLLERIKQVHPFATTIHDSKFGC
jgi:hypothetical protein